jgi:hypothetical protein
MGVGVEADGGRRGRHDQWQTLRCGSDHFEVKDG